jgi:hypothetical protein
MRVALLSATALSGYLVKCGCWYDMIRVDYRVPGHQHQWLSNIELDSFLRSCNIPFADGVPVTRRTKVLRLRSSALRSFEGRIRAPRARSPFRATDYTPGAIFAATTVAANEDRTMVHCFIFLSSSLSYGYLAERKIPSLNFNLFVTETKKIVGTHHTMQVRIASKYGWERRISPAIRSSRALLKNKI